MRTFASVLLILLLLPSPAHAVLPPDIIFSVTSTLTQSFVAISVILSGMWLSLSTYMRANSFRFWIVQVCIAAILIGGIVSIFLFSQQEPPRTHVSVPHVQEGVRPEMSALRIVLIGKNTAEPLAVEFDLNVREKEASFEFYHYAAFVSGTRTYSAYTAGTTNALTIAPVGYLHTLEVTRAPDLSARYSIDLSAVIEEQRIDARIKNLSGDFLEKNTPLYFKEASIGTAELQVNGVSVDANVFVSPVYSRDYTKQVYFEGFNDVRGLATQFIVFDTEGNAYVVDRSDVTNPVPAYTSHQWVLLKRIDGAAYKGFRATVQGNALNEKSTAWEVTSLDVPFTLSLSSGTRYAGELHGRTVSGTVKRADGSVVPVVGIAHIESL